MSTRDDSEDRDGLKPVSFDLPLRAIPREGESSLPVHDLRFEGSDDGSDDPAVDDPADTVDDVARGGDVADDDGGGAVRIRHRSRGAVPSAAPTPNAAPASQASVAGQAHVSEENPETAPGDDDRPASPEAPGVQISDAPASRIREATLRIQRRVRLEQNLSASAAKTKAGQAVLQEIVHETDEEFDRRFLDDAREAFGEGFIPAAQIPGELGDRVRHVVMVAQDYAKDFILEQVERMLIAKVPIDTIAARFRVTVSRVYTWRKQLKKKYASKVRELRVNDAASVIGEQLSQFELRMSMGMQLAQKPDATLQQIRAGLEIAERAHTNMLKYHEMLGFYNDAPLAKTKDVSNSTDEHVRKAKQVTNALEELFGDITDFGVAGDDEEQIIDGDYTSQVG